MLAVRGTAHFPVVARATIAASDHDRDASKRSQLLEGIEQQRRHEEPTAAVALQFVAGKMDTKISHGASLQVATNVDSIGDSPWERYRAIFLRIGFRGIGRPSQVDVIVSGS